ncbi:TPA: hypothetical protein N0F65_005476 [Lagenidium giganteum]|uniref:proline--tRNA ligase n=1 Tax=Lagenidium giganteum TaxID=4803 RepID=A0AAV2Z1N3_9STRA|nr:TPA: hypothetical protein N0F65_005476 [Lagenidium giganteum]
MLRQWSARAAPALRAPAAASLHRVHHALSTQTRTFSSAYSLRSKLWIPTEKEVPADAAIPSHQLLIRGGVIRKSGHGVFTFLPLGKRIIAKLEAVIDAEMATIHGNKLDLPLIIPSELWKQSGRWQTRGPELMTFADRREDVYALAPTHEESITSLVANHYQNTNDSLRLYQIGKKFRDEIRPRFGLLRAREFIMKDMYSFDTTYDGALATYKDVVRAYHAILQQRLKLPIAQVEADSGNIGGNLSHEFHVLAPIGEDAILACASNTCGYAANVEKAHGALAVRDGGALTFSEEQEAIAAKAIELAGQAQMKVWTQLAELAATTTADASGFQVKVFEETLPESDSADKATPRVAVVLVRGDREVNDLSLKSYFNGEELRAVPLASCAHRDVGDVQVFVDSSLTGDHVTSSTAVAQLLDQVVQSQQECGVQVHCGHFRSAEEGDTCPKCANATLEAKRGIEVGHVFYLGQKYSKPFNVTFTEHEDGTNVKKVMEMGCFGMGVTRLIAAAVEVSHDKHGIVWPVAIAPYKVVVMPIGSKTAEDPLSKAAIDIADQLASGSVPQLDGRDVVLDDRWLERPGSKLTESELLGYPYRVVVGKRFATEGLVEVQTRATMDKAFVRPSDLPAFFNDLAARGDL